jgi:hypothetical protein
MVSLKEPAEVIHHMMHPSCNTAKTVSRGVGLLGIVVVSVAVVATVMMLPDIKRYMRIKTM